MDVSGWQGDIPSALYRQGLPPVRTHPVLFTPPRGGAQDWMDGSAHLEAKPLAQDEVVALGVLLVEVLDGIGARAGGVASERLQTWQNRGTRGHTTRSEEIFSGGQSAYRGENRDG